MAVAVIASLLVGAGVGLINGFFVVQVGVGAFITTLATGTILSGLTIAVSNGEILNGVPQSLQDFASHQFLGLATPVYLALGTAVVLWYIYEHRRSGVTCSSWGRVVTRHDWLGCPLTDSDGLRLLPRASSAALRESSRRRSSAAQSRASASLTSCPRMRRRFLARR